MVEGAPPPPAFKGYRRMAIVTYIVSDVLLVAAALAWFFVSVPVAIFLGVLAVLFTLAALRCAQVTFIRPQIEDSIDPGETIRATIGARRGGRVSALRSPLFLVFTGRQLYVFKVGFKVGEPLHRVPLAAARDFWWDEQGKTVQVRLPAETLALVGVDPEEAVQAQNILRNL